MYVHTYVTGSSNTGIPVRLKIENNNDPTQSVETEAYKKVRLVSAVHATRGTVQVNNDGLVYDIEYILIFH